jgi:hypothetical protein
MRGRAVDRLTIRPPIVDERKKLLCQEDNAFGMDVAEGCRVLLRSPFQTACSDASLPALFTRKAKRVALGLESASFSLSTKASKGSTPIPTYDADPEPSVTLLTGFPFRLRVDVMLNAHERLDGDG